jgi:DNA mismatch repair protein MutS
VGDDVVFLHRLVDGPASRSYGIAVARLAGLPESVLARAKAILGTLESGDHLTPGPAARNERQLDLFRAVSPADAQTKEVVETLKAVDPDRLTPLDALQLLAKLKSKL